MLLVPGASGPKRVNHTDAAARGTAHSGTAAIPTSNGHMVSAGTETSPEPDGRTSIYRGRNNESLRAGIHVPSERRFGGGCQTSHFLDLPHPTASAPVLPCRSRDRRRTGRRRADCRYLPPSGPGTASERTYPEIAVAAAVETSAVRVPPPRYRNRERYYHAAPRAGRGGLSRPGGRSCARFTPIPPFPLPASDSATPHTRGAFTAARTGRPRHG